MTTTAQSMVPKESWAALEQASALPGDYAASARAVVKALTESLEFESVGEPTASERFRKAEPTRLMSISYAVFCLKQKNTTPERCEA